MSTTRFLPFTLSVLAAGLPAQEAGGTGVREPDRSRAAALLAGLVALPAPSTSLRAEAAPVAPDPFFGTWSDGMSPTRERAAAEMDRHEAAGLGMIRQYVFWDRIETSPGTYDWSTTDRLVDDAAERGIRILPTRRPMVAEPGPPRLSLRP